MYMLCIFYQKYSRHNSNYNCRLLITFAADAVGKITVDGVVTEAGTALATAGTAGAGLPSATVLYSGTQPKSKKMA